MIRMWQIMFAESTNINVGYDSVAVKIREDNHRCKDR